MLQTPNDRDKDKTDYHCMSLYIEYNVLYK